MWPVLRCVALAAAIALPAALLSEPDSSFASRWAPALLMPPSVDMRPSMPTNSTGGATASGQRFSLHELSAAHRTLPFGTKVRVVNPRNDRSVIVRINDRGPFVRGRVIDLTPKGARMLGFSGLVRVKLERL